MATNYTLSVCHLAEITDKFLCSWCGKEMYSVEHQLNPQITMPHDIELTLRRWKEDDCTTPDMFSRLQTERVRAYYDVVNPLRKVLQKGKPMFEYSIERMRWETADEALSSVEGSDTKRVGASRYPRN